MSFEELPKVIKEEIFCRINDLREVARLRGVNKKWKELIDNSSRKEMEQIRNRKREYEQIKNHQKRYKNTRDLISKSGKTWHGCACCVGDLLPCVSLGFGWTFYCCLSLCTIKFINGRLSSGDFCLYFCCSPCYFVFMLPVGLILLLLGLVIELLRLILWTLTFGYFACPSRRRKYCTKKFQVFQVQRYPHTEQYREEVDFKTACSTIFCGYNGERVARKQGKAFDNLFHCKLTICC